MSTPVELFEEALDWLRANYANRRFFCERDIVWTVQKRLLELIATGNQPYQVFNDYPMLPGMRRSLSADLVILDGNSVAVAVEFKYEPGHKRADIVPAKLPVVSWGNDGAGKDVQRIHTFVSLGKSQVAYSIFIDEGGYFSHRPPHPNSTWSAWENDVHVLCARASNHSGLPPQVVMGKA
jgi:hypothetical protein